MKKSKCFPGRTAINKSNWTPATHEPSKEAIFKERMKLITNWFDMWTHPQRLRFFDHFLKRCGKELLGGVENFFVERVPVERIDFTTIFPRHLALLVFSYLDPKSLSRASVVSWHWNALAEQDVLWIRKCVKHAWYLPFNPPSNQIGSWKRHYIACIRTLDFKVGDKSRWSQEQEDEQKLIERKQQTVNHKLWKAVKRSIKNKTLEARSAWKPSNKYPKDLVERRNHSKQSTNDWDYDLENFGLQRINLDTSSSLVTKWRETKDALVMTNESDIEIMLGKGSQKKRNTTLSEELKLENLKEKRISEMKEFQNQHPRFWDPKNIVESFSIPIAQNVTSDFYRRSEVRKVILISSEVPACDILVCSLLPDVVHLLYDYNSTTLDSLIYRVQSLVKKGSRPLNIGFFPHHEKPGKLSLTKHFRGSIGAEGSSQMVKFFKTITGLLEDDGRVEIFQPISCSKEGRELLVMLSSNCGVEFQSPISILKKYRLYDDHWFSTSPTKRSTNGSPSEIYFSQEKFTLWSNKVELIEEACEKVSRDLAGYFRGVQERMMSETVGLVMYNVFGFDSSAHLKKIAYFLTRGFETLEDCPAESDVLLNLGKYLQFCQEHEMKKSEAEIQSKDSPKFDASWIDNRVLLGKTLPLHEGSCSDDETSDKKDDFEATSSHIDTKSYKHPKVNETFHEVPIHQSESGQLLVFNELLLSETFYNSCLKSLIQVFKKPIMVSMETNRAMISWQNARLLFADITQLYEISCQFLDDLHVMKKRSSKLHLGQLFLRFLKSFQSLLSAYLLVYPSILETYDKCKRQSHHFRVFLKRFELSFSSLMMSLPELYMKPWKRVDEYIRLMMTYRSTLPQDHHDIHDIDISLHSLDCLTDIITKNIQRIHLQQQMEVLQDKIKNCPRILEGGRHFIKEIEAACLLPPEDSIVPELRVYRHSEDLHFYLFNDCLLCAAKLIQNIPFKSCQRETEVFVQTSSLRYIRIANMSDSPYIRNGFRMWTPMREWICSVRDDSTKFDWISALDQTILLHLNV